MTYKNSFLFLITTLSLFSCNFNMEKALPLESKNQFNLVDLPAEEISQLSFSLVSQKIFASKCVSCHGNAGGINLESYPEVVKNINLIKKAVFDKKTMPKNGSLTNEELSYLWNWIKIGAPEQPQNGNTNPLPNPLPDPLPGPILATYDSINKNIFQNSCKDCHNSAGSGKRILFDKDALLNSPLELVIPGNPDESGLIVALERNDNKRMPPAKEGYSALTDEAKWAIRKWIENGAKD